MSKRDGNKKRKFKRSNHDLRRKAKQLLKVWFDDRVDRQINRYASVKGRPVMPAMEYNLPKLARKTPVPQTKQRPMLDGNGLPMYDKETGRQVMETVAIMDTLTADGRDSTFHGIEPEIRNDASGYVGVKRKGDESAIVTRARSIMLQVDNIAPEYKRVLEMHIAGYDDQAVATEIGSGINTAQMLIAEGLAVMCVLIRTRIWESRESKRQPNSAGSQS